MKTEMREVNEWMDEARGLIDELSDFMSPEDEEKLKDKVEVSQLRPISVSSCQWLTAATHSRRISAGLASIARSMFIITRTARGNSK